MPGSVLHDSVTLQHFASAGRLDVLEVRHGWLPLPRWCESVHDEIHRSPQIAHCQAVIQATWLGGPEEVSSDAELDEVTRIMIALGSAVGAAVDDGEATKHEGEAESIVIAKRTDDAKFLTDDNDAFSVATTHLTAQRVKDTVDVLEDAVAMGEITAQDAAGICASIRQHGRHLRRVRPDPMPASHF